MVEVKKKKDAAIITHLSHARNGKRSIEMSMQQRPLLLQTAQEVDVWSKIVQALVVHQTGKHHHDAHGSLPQTEEPARQSHTSAADSQPWLPELGRSMHATVSTAMTEWGRMICALHIPGHSCHFERHMDTWSPVDHLSGSHRDHAPSHQVRLQAMTGLDPPSNQLPGSWAQDAHAAWLGHMNSSHSPRSYSRTSSHCHDTVVAQAYSLSRRWNLACDDMQQLWPWWKWLVTCGPCAKHERHPECVWFLPT